MMNNVVPFLPKVVAVLPAAGIGRRMHADRPKQYLTIGDKTILEHTIFALLRHSRIQRIVVVINPKDHQFQTLPIAHDPRIDIVFGGAQRADSVMAGLERVGHAEWVLIHDAVRPCLHLDDLNHLLALTEQSETGGILVAPARDTMKRAKVGTASIAYTVERENLWCALTPQLFPFELLKTCLAKALMEGVTVTDEASALEYCGYHPLLVNSRSDNIKVTHPEDLAFAQFYLTQLYKKKTQ